MIRLSRAALASISIVGYQGSAFAQPRPAEAGRVKTVTAADLARAKRYTVETDGAVTLGGVSRDVDLSLVESVVILSDGRVATFSVVGSHLLIFDRRGAVQRRWGGVGEGPGQFVRAYMEAAAGDTLALVDAGTGRMTWLHPDRGRVRDRTCAPCFTREAEELVGVLRDGRTVLSSFGRRRGGPTLERERLRASLAVANPFTNDYTQILEVPDLVVVRRETRYRGRSRTEGAVIGFTPRAHAVTVHDHIVVGDSDRPEFEIRRPDGALVVRIKLSGIARRAVTPAMKQAVIEERLAQLHAPGGEGLIDEKESVRLIRESPFADSLPAFRNLLTGVDGTWWVVDAHAPSDAHWGATQFNLRGEVMGRLEGAFPGLPVAIGRDRVVLRQTDADGDVLLRAYAIR